MAWKDILKEASQFDDKETEIDALNYTIKRLKEEYDEFYETRMYEDEGGSNADYYEAKFEEMKRQNLEPFPKETQQRILKYYRMEGKLHYAKEQLIKDLKDLRDHIEEFAGE
mgnify:CR=1 FL=1